MQGVKKRVRRQLYKIIAVLDDSHMLSKFYNILNIIIILISLLPLMFKQSNSMLAAIDRWTVTFFIGEYMMYLVTADYQYPDKTKWQAFLTYPFSFFGIIDFLSILPSFAGISSTFRLLRVFRLFRSLRVFRAFKLFRYSRSTKLLIDTIKNQKDSLILIATLTLMYLLIVALVMFNTEPDLFNSFRDAVYWATMSLTTSTYGNFYPESWIGQVFTQISLLVGVIIIALPTSIITAGYASELGRVNQSKSANKEKMQK